MIKNNLDDDVEFAEIAGSEVTPPKLEAAPDNVNDDNEVDRERSGYQSKGHSTQYSRYGAGFMPTTETVTSLPPACYDVECTPNGQVFVIPSLPPSGLLLELPEMRSDAVIRLVDTFWNSEKDYKHGNEFVRGGAAYKAGILIYGPPGTGKSCTIKIVSKKLVERGGTVFYGDCHPGLLVKFVGDFARIEKDRKSIIILEDLDSLINQYGESRYLDMLDSAKTIDNVLFIATTNYPERLDQRIFNRPGRFSHTVKIGFPGTAAREAFLKALLKNHRDVEQIVSLTDGFSIDHLSALINAVYREKKELTPEIARLRALFKLKTSDEDKKGMGLGT